MKGEGNDPTQLNVIRLTENAELEKPYLFIQSASLQQTSRCKKAYCIVIQKTNNKACNIPKNTAD